MNKVRDEESFADLVPELRTLARGWTWRLCEAIPGDRNTAQYIRSVSFVVLMTTFFGILWSILDSQGVVSTASIVGVILISIFGGLVASAICAAISGDVRKIALQRKAGRYSPGELQELAERTMATFKIILRTATIEPKTRQFIEEHGLDPEQTKAELDRSINRLREDVEKTVSGLLSSSVKSKSEALSRLAASDEGCFAYRIRFLRQAQSNVRKKAEREVLEKETKDKLQAFMNQHAPSDEPTTGTTTDETQSCDTGGCSNELSSFNSPANEASLAKTFPPTDAKPDEKQGKPSGLKSPWSFPLAETILLTLSGVFMVIFWGIADFKGDPEMVQRGGALALVLAAVAERIANDRQIKKIQSKAYGDMKINDPVIPEKTVAESFVFGTLIVLVILGTVVWGFGDLFYEWITY